MRRQRDDGQGIETPVGTQALCGGVAVHDGHLQVHQYHVVTVGAYLLQMVQGLLAVVHHRHFSSLGLHELARQDLVHAVVFGHQYLQPL